MRPFLIFAIPLYFILLASCSNPNGKYVVLKIQRPNSGNDTINNLLNDRLQGKQFDVKFTKDYASMEDKDHNIVYLSPEKNITSSSDLYRKTSWINRVRYTVSLYNHDHGKLLYIVRVDGKVNDIFSPAQSINLPPWGEAQCSLVKIDK